MFLPVDILPFFYLRLKRDTMPTVMPIPTAKAAKEMRLRSKRKEQKVTTIAKKRTTKKLQKRRIKRDCSFCTLHKILDYFTPPLYCHDSVTQLIRFCPCAWYIMERCIFIKWTFIRYTHANLFVLLLSLFFLLQFTPRNHLTFHLWHPNWVHSRNHAISLNNLSYN